MLTEEMTMRCVPLAILLLGYSTTYAAELPFYATAGVLLSQTNGVAATDVPSFGVFIGNPGELPPLPEELPLNGQPFDDDDSGFSASIGYQFSDWFALELGYQDLGSFSSNFPSLSTIGSVPDPAMLDVSGTSLKAQFQYPLSDHLSATWHLALTRADFEAQGSAVVGFFVGPFPPPPVPPVPPVPPNFVEIPYSNPDDETGIGFGFGLSWAFNEHFEAELAYSRQDLQVLEFDSMGLRLIARL